MVGLVVVSHSRALARAAVALAAEMVPGSPIVIAQAAGLDSPGGAVGAGGAAGSVGSGGAAGLDSPGGSVGSGGSGADGEVFGTDAAAVMDAIAAADSGDGVVVLMDLGSAVLSAEMAVEMLDDEARDRVVICPAPLVEGLVAAAVTAAGGASRAEVAAEAMAGLAGKLAHVEAPVPPTGPAGAPPAVVRVTNEHGLHARPAARLVSEARRLDPEMEIRNRTTNSAWVSAASLSRVATLGVLHDHEIELRGERRAVEALVALAGRDFDEARPPTASPGSGLMGGASAGVGDASAGVGGAPASEGAASARALVPVDGVTPSAGLAPASPGIGIGPARILTAALPDFSDLSDGEWGRLLEAAASTSSGPGGARDAERARLDDALAAVRAEIAAIPDGQGIFDAHLLLLDDADLLGDARSRIEEGESAGRAWAAAAGRVAAEFEALADPYLKARAADVRAVAGQVLHALLDAPGPTAAAGAAAVADAAGSDAAGSDAAGSDAAGSDAAGADREVLVAGDLTPAEAALLDPGRVAGVLLAFGSPVSHAAILTRARGIPAVVGAGPSVLDVLPGTMIALDGGTGEFVVDPAAEVLAGFRSRAAEAAARRESARTRARAPAVTRDGVAIAVGVNVGSVADARAAFGADHAGLVRTEFLFLDRGSAPTVDEQVAAYRAIAEALGGRPVTLRTLDVGGDKPLRYVDAGRERNPYLGVRGIRHSLAHPELLRTQLAAIVQVARETPVSVMFPMVSTVGELRRAREILDAAGPPAGLRVGIMVEVPAAALKAGEFAPLVDFVSIGTNDLIQYTMAAERGNPAVAELADGHDPAVVRLIELVCRSVPDVAVCGELAADETAIPLLIGLGVRSLSVAPPAVPAVKEAVRAAIAARA